MTQIAKDIPRLVIENRRQTDIQNDFSIAKFSKRAGKKVSFSSLREIQPTAFSPSPSPPLPTFRKTSSVFDSPFFRDSNCRKISLGSCLSAKNKPRTFLTFSTARLYIALRPAGLPVNFHQRTIKKLSRRFDFIRYFFFFFFLLFSFLFDSRTDIAIISKITISFEKNYIRRN